MTEKLLVKHRGDVLNTDLDSAKEMEFAAMFIFHNFRKKLSDEDYEDPEQRTLEMFQKAYEELEADN